MSDSPRRSVEHHFIDNACAPVLDTVTLGHCLSFVSLRHRLCRRYRIPLQLFLAYPSVLDDASGSMGQ